MKKIIAMILALVLTSAVAIGGTMAYLTSEDSDVNVMTIGNVKIDQLEYERDPSGATVTSAKYGEGYKLVPFSQNKPLYPATGAVTGWEETPVYYDQLDANKASGGQKMLAGLSNVQDKIVLVRNTGRSAAYIRTIFAFESGSATFEEWDEAIMLNVNDTHWNWNEIGIGVIDGNNYVLTEVTYKGLDGGRHSGGILPAGEYSYSSLAQIYMTAASTNEDVEALDGNNNGTYDILVLSQAVQTEGFADAKSALDTAFGESTIDSVPGWFSETSIPVVVNTAEEFADAMTAGGNIILGKDITLDADNTISVANGQKVNLDLNGKKITAVTDGTGNRDLFIVKGEMSVSNGSIELNATVNQGWNAMASIFDVTAGGVLNIDNADMSVGGTDMNFCVHLNNWGEVTLNVNNSNLNATYCAVRVFNSGFDRNNVSIHNSKLTGLTRAFWVHNYFGDFTDARHTEEAILGRMNFDIFGNGNTFEITGTATSPIRYGYNTPVYIDLDGNQIP